MRFIPMATRGRSWWQLAKVRGSLSPEEWVRVAEIVFLVIVLCGLASYLVGQR